MKLTTIRLNTETISKLAGNYLDISVRRWVFHETITGDEDVAPTDIIKIFGRLHSHFYYDPVIDFEHNYFLAEGRHDGVVYIFTSHIDPIDVIVKKGAIFLAVRFHKIFIEDNYAAI